MEQELEFIKKAGKISVKKYCIKYNVNYSNLVKGNVKDKSIITKIKEELENEMKNIIEVK